MNNSIFDQEQTCNRCTTESVNNILVHYQDSGEYEFICYECIAYLVKTTRPKAQEKYLN